jgi:hypothetical protein
MLRAMWLLPLIAAGVAFVFAAMLGRQYLQRRGDHRLMWSIAMLMYGFASLAVAAGVANGWSDVVFEVYWALGAVLNVPFLAGGEIVLLFRQPWVRWATWLVLIFTVAYTLAVLGSASMDAVALAEELPSGKEVFGAGTAAHRLPQYFSISAYVILLAGALWSAWRMRGRPELRDRFWGTLLIAVGATVVAGGSTFAALGVLAGFIATLVGGIVLMFWGFLLASRSVQPAPAPRQES